MGIKALNKWLYSKNYIQPIDDFSKLKIDTLFIDGSELLVIFILKYGKKDMVPYFLLHINKIFKCMKPIDKVFFSLDGPSPAAKFQSERNSMFFHKRNQIYNFEYPTEQEFKRRLQQEQENVEGVTQALNNFFPQLINEDNIQTKEILYSSRYAPGESEHKYIKYFRDQKQSNQLKPNQNHFIISNDNDLIFLTLQFIDENFFVLKYEKDDPSVFSILDISSIRNNLLEYIKKSVTKSFDNSRVINDIIGLSFILGNDFVPRFPDIDEDGQIFDQLIDAYCKMNMEIDNSEYNYLIDNDSFNVSVLKQIIKIFFENTSQYDQVRNYNQDDRIHSLNNERFYYMNENKKLNRIHSFHSRFNENPIHSFHNERPQFYHYNQNKPLNRIHSFHNERFRYVNNNENNPQNRISSFNDEKYHLSHFNSQRLYNQNSNNDFHYSYSNNKSQIESSETEDFHDDEEDHDPKLMAQSILRIFNFTWLYYAYGVPSWTYYYPFKNSPPLKEAVELMTQEGKEFFENLQDKESTDPLLKSLITLPATKTNGIPWEIYKLKIPPSPLAKKYFPLSPNAPMFDLDDIKKNYKEALKTLPKEDQIYNRREKPFLTYSKSMK